MSDSESDVAAWRKSDRNKDMSISKIIPKRAHLNNSLSEEPPLKRQKSNYTIKNQDENESINFITQPPMLLFKHFLNQQEDNILIEDAMRKYNEYKEAFACEQLQSFFEAHKDEEWFMEKYHPDYIENKKNRRLECIENRRKIFIWLYEHKWMDDISVHINCQNSLIKLFDSVAILLEGGNENDLVVLEKRIYRAESPERTEIKIDMKVKNDSNTLKWDDFHTSSAEEDSDVEITSGLPLKEANDKDVTCEKETVVIPVPVQEPPKKERTPEEIIETEDRVQDEMLVSAGIDPRPLHKTCSIFLRNIHPSVFRSQIEEIVKTFSGYLRLALQDPMPERQFLRRGWVTFERSSDIKNVVWQLSKTKLLDVDLGAVINKEISQRIRPTPAITNHRAVMRQDVKYAAKLVARFDKRRHLWEQSPDDCNPLLRNITEHLVDEGSYEEEAYLGGDISNNLAITGGHDPANIRLDEDRELSQVLDRLLLYLRVVHSFDYYSATEYDIEDVLPHRCALMHARGNLAHPEQRLHQIQLERYMKQFETKAELVLDSVDSLDVAIAARLGVKSVDEVVEKFIADNTKELSAEKWLCPLSGKKFKGPEYVRKHIVNKFGDRLDNVRHTVQFFNNYILDPRRPQLPEHPSNRPNQLPIGPVVVGGDRHQHNRFESTRSSVHGHRYGQDYSAGSPRQPPMREENSYRKGEGRSDLNSRGSGQGGGSYYSRKIMHYNDISVAD